MKHAGSFHHVRHAQHANAEPKSGLSPPPRPQPCQPQPKWLRMLNHRAVISPNKNRMPSQPRSLLKPQRSQSTGKKPPLQTSRHSSLRMVTTCGRTPTNLGSARLSGDACGSSLAGTGLPECSPGRRQEPGRLSSGRLEDIPGVAWPTPQPGPWDATFPAADRGICFDEAASSVVRSAHPQAVPRDPPRGISA